MNGFGRLRKLRWMSTLIYDMGHLAGVQQVEASMIGSSSLRVEQ